MTDLVLWQSLATFLIVGAVAGIALGLLLILKADKLPALNRLANRWIAVDHIGHALDKQVSVESWFYRRHRMLGAFILLGATYILIHFGMLIERTPFIAKLSAQMPLTLAEGVADALVLIALSGGAVALSVGLFLYFRPSLLKDIEQHSNRWVSGQRVIDPLDARRDHIDHFVMRHAQRAGWLLLLGSICLLAILLRPSLV
ncbi:MAG: hypothetical protein PHY62_09440 [Gallionella sp.]|nr:hypothetical protein [Gallionella sp.]